MTSPLRVKVVVCRSGERLPLLLHRETGLPLFAANVYALTQVRGRSRAANTIERCLRSLAFLHAFLDSEGIDLEERLAGGMLLDPHELDRLSDAARHHLEDLIDRSPASVAGAHPRRLRRTRIGDHSAATRLQSIRDYLGWMSSRRLSILTAASSDYKRLRVTREAVLEGLNARVPAIRHYTRAQRLGLSHEEEQALLSVLDPHCETNPWTSSGARIRNRLLVLWLLHLGIRQGELLSIRVGDINFRLHEVEVVRRHDAPDDPRRRQPVVKTHGRALPIDILATLTEEYVLTVRRALSGARRHPFLFVDLRSGAPLSASALGKVFRELRAHPSITDRLTPHILRHTWNTRFSEAMDSKGVAPEDEERMRTYLQGWTPGTGTAATYTRRHVRERARLASIELQRAMARRGPDE